jgi:outer membrane receptor protein involved in Fe transport
VDLGFDGFGEARPILLDRSLLGTSVDDPAKATQQLPLSAFRVLTITDGADQIVPRNAFFGDGLEIVDLGLYKNFRIDSSKRLTLRVEVYNLFDTVQYGFPNAAVTTPGTFGTLTGGHATYNPRTVQIAIRFTY